ncbi:Pentatricopeptide repeat-containing protein [Platanthera zijinensis]|uniref:Pentatricopeptide repeat-containing protein n=1 Tax=Platanthera zijinensis TaxID=2320716 RepID=A0AAP0B7F7_9ASPA
MAMPKSGDKLPLAALRKVFNATGAEEVTSTSELATLKKLLSRPHDNPLTSASSSSVPRESSKKNLSCLADRFVLQLNKASAKNSEEAHVPAQESLFPVTWGISSIIPSSEEEGNKNDTRKKETSRFRKQKILHKSTKSGQFQKLMKLCADKLDVESTLGVFGRVGREISLTEFKTLIRLWIEKARKVNGEDSLGYIQKVHQVFIAMRERGFQISEDCYGPFLVYLIDMRMKDEFYVFTKFIKDYDHDSYNKIGYYEMLLWIKIGDGCKIKELCNSIMGEECNDNNKLAESYLLALCENDMEEELIRLLEVFNTSISSLDNGSCIFKSIGRLQLENVAENFILAFKSRGTEEENISSFIYDYTSSIPNLAVRNFS